MEQQLVHMSRRRCCAHQFYSNRGLLRVYQYEGEALVKRITNHCINTVTLMKWKYSLNSKIYASGVAQHSTVEVVLSQLPLSQGLYNTHEICSFNGQPVF